jgi:dTDP-4-dehydrorhamnose 3,5-epimerase-like enzyme
MIMPLLSFAFNIKLWRYSEGKLRDATVDCRSNAPLFRITRPCVIQNLDIDFTG